MRLRRKCLVLLFGLGFCCLAGGCDALDSTADRLGYVPADECCACLGDVIDDVVDDVLGDL